MIIPLRDEGDFPRLVSDHELDDGYGIAPRGYRTDITVEIRQGVAFPIAFYEAAALCEELQARAKWGFGGFVAEPGLVVIPEISVASMKAAALELISIEYFQHLKPVAECAANQTLNPTGNKPAS